MIINSFVMDLKRVRHVEVFIYKTVLLRRHAVFAHFDFPGFRNRGYEENRSKIIEQRTLPNRKG